MVRILIHPGEHLADELKALGMSANELAKELGVPTNRLTEIIRGKRGISGDTALRLGRWFGTGPEIWSSARCSVRCVNVRFEICFSTDAATELISRRSIGWTSMGFATGGFGGALGDRAVGALLAAWSQSDDRWLA